jgi:cytochrome b pre-mRNA-processing protein 3
MFADMDINLREMGVGDMTIAKRVRAMWEAFHGRALAYAPALAQGDQATLSAALARNVWRGQAPEGAAVRLARAALAQDRHLSSLGLAELRAGGTIFLPSAQVLS